MAKKTTRTKIKDEPEDKVYTCIGRARHGCGGGARVLHRVKEEMKKANAAVREDVKKEVKKGIAAVRRSVEKLAAPKKARRAKKG